jgi:hypothetical protein
MAYETLMVYVGLGSPNDELLKVAGDLAVQFHACLIGIAARQPARVRAGEGFVFWDRVNGDRDSLHNEIEHAEAEFRGALRGRVADLEWRSTAMCASIAGYLAHEAQSADVLIIDIAADLFNSSRWVNACDFATQLGRPVIIVPTATARVDVSRAEISVAGIASGGEPALEASATFRHATRVDIGQFVDRVG